jgi:hypothetical protein
MMTVQDKVYVPVGEVFPGIQSDFRTFKSLLQGLSQVETLFWCAILNLIVSNPSDDHLTRQQYGLDYFLTTEEIVKVNEFAQENEGAQRVMIFFRGQLLELLRWSALYCPSCPEDIITFEKPEVKRRFAQAALIASDVWARRVFGDRLSMTDGLSSARKRALAPFRLSLEATLLTPDLSKSLGRGWCLFSKHFPTHYLLFESEFQSSTGLTVEEYYVCLGALITNFVNHRAGPPIFDSKTLGESTLYRDAIQRYVALEAQAIEELRHRLWGQASKEKMSSDEDAPPYSYRPLREKPILCSDSGRAIILDPVFYSETASAGPLFHLLSNEVSNSKANEIFSAFGYAFEDYACDILKRMFPDISGASPKRLSCEIDGTDQAGNEFEIDACLNDVTELVLFEMKAVVIPEARILAEDHESYLQCLREKYSVSEGSPGDRKNKGVGQLARIIKLLASREWLGQDGEFSRVRVVYPVLVVYDSLLDTPVHAHFLASEFEAYLEPEDRFQSGELRKGGLRIAPLTVMTVDDLENLETSIEHFALRDLLSDYSKSCPDRMTSLNNFIASSKYGQQMYHSRTLGVAGLEILDKVGRLVFGEGVG